MQIRGVYYFIRPNTVYYKVINKTKNKILAEKAKIADSFISRLLGLVFRKDLRKESALIFYKASSIHTFFMRFTLDILFLDKNMEVKRLVRKLSPWRAVLCSGSFVTIEFSSKNNNLQATQEKDLIEIEKVV